MKVTISYIDSGKEEAHLMVRAGHRSLDALCSIIAQETYKEYALPVTAGNNKYQINCRYICYLESMNDKVLVHTNQREFESRKKLYELEEVLPEAFARISKSMILNLDQVEHYSPQINGLMKASLKSGTVVYISRKYLKTLRDKIGGKNL